MKPVLHLSIRHEHPLESNIILFTVIAGEGTNLIVKHKR